LAWQCDVGAYVATFVSTWVQLLFLMLLLWRSSRIAALVAILGMHRGIGLFLGLWPFSLAMIALDLLFVRDASWRRVLAWGSSRGWALWARRVQGSDRSRSVSATGRTPAGVNGRQ
jgi:hypothetical protein